eukprot:gene28342-37274_t
MEEGNESTYDNDPSHNFPSPDGDDFDPNVTTRHSSTRSRAKLRGMISRPTQFKRERGTSGSLQLVSVRLKEAGNTYLRHMNEMERSRFAGWSKAELCELLISEKIELRNEGILEVLPLRDLADNLFTGRSMPQKPHVFNRVDIVFANIMARRIQNSWIAYISLKRIQHGYQSPTEHIRPSTQPDDELDLAVLSEFDINQDSDISSREDGEETAERDIHLNLDLESNAGAAAAVESASLSDRRTRKMNILNIPWEKPSEEKAKKYADYVQPRKGGKGGTPFDMNTTTTGRFCCLGSCGEQLDLWEEGQVSEFGIYGAGIANYFKYLKFLYWLFFALSLVALPSLVLNFYGPYSTRQGLSELSRTTVGNLAPSTSNGTVLVLVPGCNNYGLYDIQCTLNSNSLARFYSYLDIAVCAIFLIGYFWVKFFESEEETSLDSNTVNASMYTIKVSGLPPDVTEEELIDHFNSLIRKSFQRNSTTIVNSSNVDYTIAAISLAYDNVEEIEECISRGDLIRSKIKLVHEHRYNCTKLLAKEVPNVDQEISNMRESMLQKMKQKNRELRKKQELLESYAKKPAKAIFAFVTFNRVSAKDTVVFMYKRGLNILSWIFNRDKLSIRGYKLKVEDAPEPSTIIWENLSYNWYSRILRRCLTVVMSLLLILVSLVTIFCSKYFSETTSGSSSGSKELCSDIFTTATEQQKRTFAQQNPDQLHCYCDPMGTIQQSGNSMCQTYLQDNIKAQVFQYFAAFVVIAVNLMLENGLKYFVTFEKHHTEDTKGESVFMRLFVLKYINTAAVFFINNNDYILRTVFGLNPSSAYDTELSSQWFNTIGVTIILVQLSDAFFAHSAKAWKYMQHYYTLRFVQSEAGENLALTQEDLNKYYVGSDCELAFKYAQIMSTMYVCMTFSTGIPLLYIIAAVNFLLYYVVEKFLFIHFYKAPPHFNAHIGKSATSMIPVAVGLHLAMSIWVLSNPELFSTEASSTAQAVLANNAVSTAAAKSTIQDRVLGKYTFPLFALLCAILLYEFLKFVVIRLLYSAEEYWNLWMVCCFWRSRESLSTKGKAQYLVTYTRAVQRKLIKGLSTYNMLQNPIYKEAFAITWKFAVENKTVRSVRNIKTKAQSEFDELDAEKIDTMQRNRIVESSSRKNHRKRPTPGRTSEASESSTTTTGTGRQVSASRNREFLDGAATRTPPRSRGQHRHQRLSVVDNDEKTIS